MRKLLVAGLAALAVLAPAQARAVFFLGARVVYALPSGDVQKGAPLEDDVSANVPVQLDVGMSLLDSLSLGVYASYGPSTIADDLESSPQCAGVTCKGQNLRAGLQLNFRPPVVLNSLWGGVFAGFEQQRISAGSSSTSYSGWEAGLQAGYDFSVLPLFRMGPFASYSLAQFTSVSGDGNPQLGTQSPHTALTFGLRALFDF
jgi:hypothetical protein